MDTNSNRSSLKLNWFEYNTLLVLPHLSLTICILFIEPEIRSRNNKIRQILVLCSGFSWVSFGFIWFRLVYFTLLSFYFVWLLACLAQIDGHHSIPMTCHPSEYCRWNRFVELLLLLSLFSLSLNSNLKSREQNESFNFRWQVFLQCK